MVDFAELQQAATDWNTAAWMETAGSIAYPNGDIREVDECNAFQREVSDIVQYCHEVQRPARIIILKPRRRGSSTVSVAACYRRLQSKRGSGCIAGGAHFQGKKLFKMLEIYADNDRLKPGSCDVLGDIARFANGSEVDRITLANPKAGRSGGYQVLVITEMAFLAEEGVADAAMVVSGLIKTVQFVPDTIVILESTANGASGDFYDRWQQAITFEEFKEGRNGYIKVFYPWFAFPDLRMPPASEGIHTVSDYTPDEVDLAEKWDLDMEQVAWMRWSIREECANDFEKFQEDYPFDPESAFRRSGRRRFDIHAISEMEGDAAINRPDIGTLLEQPSGSVSFVNHHDGTGMIQIWEHPIAGCRYIGALDPATDESQTIVADPDRHSIAVWRAGYHCQVRDEWRKPRLVARVRPPFTGEGDEVAGHMARLSKYYGKCLVAQEVNCGIDILKYLQLAGIPCYKRRVPSHRTGNEVEQYGFKLKSGGDRDLIISRYAAAIRERAIEVHCPHTLNEYKAFVIKKNGRAEADKGHHDDDVLRDCMAWECIDQATTYKIEKVRNVDPPDRGGPNGWRQTNATKRGW